jgi:hypothetical protein
MLTKHQLLRSAIAKSLLFTTLLFAAFCRPVTAQTQFAAWAGTFQNYKLTPRVGFYFDAQWRSTDQVKQMHSLLLRPGINFYLTPALTGTVGYAFIQQQRVSAGVTGYLPEHRIWEQLTFTHPLGIAGPTPAHGQTGASANTGAGASGNNGPAGPLASAAAHARHRVNATLTHRLRLEQRFIPRHHAEGNALVQNGHHQANRLRYFARAIVPLSKQGWFAAVQNEVFVNVGNTSMVNGKFFDQNRAYIAAGYRLSKQFDMEVGYMNQYISGAGANSTNNHIVQVATYVRL